MSAQVSVFPLFVYIPRSGIARSYGSSVCNFLRDVIALVLVSLLLLPFLCMVRVLFFRNLFLPNYTSLFAVYFLLVEEGFS